jgi:hypothetical protein
MKDPKVWVTTCVTPKVYNALLAIQVGMKVVLTLVRSYRSVLPQCEHKTLKWLIHLIYKHSCSQERNQNLNKNVTLGEYDGKRSQILIWNGLVYLGIRDFKIASTARSVVDSLYLDCVGHARCLRWTRELVCFCFQVAYFPVLKIKSYFHVVGEERAASAS